jgi:hypothetical protein
MTKKEINNYIYLKIMNGCKGGYDAVNDRDLCRCSVHIVPDYCSEKSPRSLLNDAIKTLYDKAKEMNYISPIPPGALWVDSAEYIARYIVEFDKGVK